MQVELSERSALALSVDPDSKVTIHLAEGGPVDARIAAGDDQWSVTLKPGANVLRE